MLTAIPVTVFIAIVLSLIPHELMVRPTGCVDRQAFTPRLRYSGASLGYQLASIIAGGPAPLIATALFAAYHTWLRHRDLHRSLHGHKRDLSAVHAGLYRQGHFGGI